MIEIHLSQIPPSTNRIWRSDHGRKPHKSSEYRAWLASAGWEIKAQIGTRKITGPFKLSMQMVRPDKRRRDLDNRLKAVLDVLTSMGVVEDDSLCEMISARWVTTGAAVTIRIDSATVEDGQEIKFQAQQR